MTPPVVEKPNYHCYQTKRFTYVVPDGKTPRYSVIRQQVGDWFDNPSKKLNQTALQEAKNALRGVLKLLTNDNSVEERLWPGGHAFPLFDAEGRLDLEPVSREFERISKLSSLQKTWISLVESATLYIKALIGIDDETAHNDSGQAGKARANPVVG